MSRQTTPASRAIFGSRPRRGGSSQGHTGCARRASGDDEGRRPHGRFFSGIPAAAPEASCAIITGMRHPSVPPGGDQTSPDSQVPDTSRARRDATAFERTDIDRAIETIETSTVDPARVALLGADERARRKGVVLLDGRIGKRKRENALRSE